MKQKHLITAIASGLIAGAVFGILFAPDKGKNNRKKIAKKGDEYKHLFKDKIDEFFKSLSKQKEGTEEELKNLFDENTEKLELVKREAKEIKN